MRKGQRIVIPQSDKEDWVPGMCSACAERFPIKRVLKSVEHPNKHTVVKVLDRKSVV